MIGFLSTPSGAGVKTIAKPPTKIKIPEIIIYPPNPFDFSLSEMKNAIIGKIIAGPPSPIPLCISSNGKNPSWSGLPIETATSAPYNANNKIDIPANAIAAFSAILEFTIHNIKTNQMDLTSTLSLI